MMQVTLLAGPSDVERLLGRIPSGRLGNSDDVAAAVSFLPSDDAEYMTGAMIHVDGGHLADVGIAPTHELPTSVDGGGQ